MIYFLSNGGKMKALDIFVNGIGRLLKSNLLSSGKEIRQFLMTVTEDETLKDILKSACADFETEKEFSRVLESGRLPLKDEKLVAFVTSVLFMTDTGDLPLTDLLSILYPDGNEYEHFLDNMIKPYAESFVNLIVGEPCDVFKEPEHMYSDKLNEDVSELAKQIKLSVKKSSLPQNAAENVISALEGLCYALPFNDLLLTRNAYSGFINTLRLYGINTDYENDLSRLLKLYGVL